MTTNNDEIKTLELAPGERSYPPAIRAEALSRFLEDFRNYGSVSRSCRQSGIGRTTLYDWLSKYPEVKEAMDEAQEAYNDLLREEIHRRAVIGEPKPVYDKSGQLVNTLMQKSDLLLIFQAKARMPEYRDKTSGDTNIQINISRGGPELEA